jgi:hypothetical protein
MPVTKPRIKPRSAKAKGTALQTKVLEAIRDAFPDFTEDDLRVAIGGETGEDIRLTGRARARLKGVSIECKNHKKLALPAWWRQSKANTAKHGAKNPVVLFQHGHDGVLAVITFKFLLDLLSGLQDNAVQVPDIDLDGVIRILQTVQGIGMEESLKRLSK